MGAKSREATGLARLRDEGYKRRFFLASLNWHPLRDRLIGGNATFHTSFAWCKYGISIFTAYFCSKAEQQDCE